MNELIEQLEALLHSAHKLNEEMVNAYAENAYLRQYLQDKFPGLAEKVFKTEYLGEWKDDNGRD